MTIYVLNGLNGKADVVQTYKSVIWNCQFFEPGEFVLVVPGTAENIALLQPGTLLVREDDIVSDTEFHNVMQVKDVKYSYDVEEGWLYEVSGKGLKDMVRQRIVWSQTNLSGSIETGIRTVITQNIISPSVNARRIPNFILAAAAGITATFETQLFADNIAEWLTEVGKTYGIGWDVYIKNGKYVFALSSGTDRSYEHGGIIPVIFSPDYDNLPSAEYSRTLAEYQNAALVGGEGEGTDQVLTSVGTASGLNRFEGYVDGGNVSSNGEIITMEQYIQLLQEYGKEQITQKQFVTKFSGELVPVGLYTLNEDYFLGDIVKIQLHSFTATSRIIEIIYAEDENGYSLTPTFSEWEDIT